MDLNSFALKAILRAGITIAHKGHSKKISMLTSFHSFGWAHTHWFSSGVIQTFTGLCHNFGSLCSKNLSGIIASKKCSPCQLVDLKRNPPNILVSICNSLWYNAPVQTETHWPQGTEKVTIWIVWKPSWVWSPKMYSFEFWRLIGSN